MLGITHIAAGVLTAGALVAYVQPTPIKAVAVTAGVVLGSLFPDLDTKNSTLSQMVKPVGVVVSTVTGHRKLIHDPVFYALSIITLYLFVPKFCSWFLPMAIGIATHLLLDSLNPMGIPICYYPTRGKWRLRLLKIKTGSVGEEIIQWLLWFVAIYTWFQAFKIWVL